MIKFFVLVSLAVALVIAEEQYSTKYDNINIDEILANPRLYTKYVDCLLEKAGAKCTPDGKFLKDTMPDALKTDCSKCSPKQKENSEKLVKYMLKNKPDDYKKIEEKYDPEQTYRKKFGN